MLLFLNSLLKPPPVVLFNVEQPVYLYTVTRRPFTRLTLGSPQLALKLSVAKGSHLQPVSRWVCAF
jgi:hypothetical protein